MWRQEVGRQAESIRPQQEVSTEVIRQMSEDISEIIEREEEKTTVITELQEEVKKTGEALGEIRTKAEALEKEKQEEKRDADRERKVQELFDNSIRLERLRHGL